MPSYNGRLTLLAAALVALFAVALIPYADAQMFQNFFGGHGGGMFGGHSREQEPPPAGDARWFHDRVNAAQCSQFLCPATLSCVTRPSHCPCPFPQQIRCSYRDTDSAAAERAEKAGGNFDGVDAQLAMGGTVCVTADSCDEVAHLLSGADLLKSS